MYVFSSAFLFFEKSAQSSPKSFFEPNLCLKAYLIFASEEKKTVSRDAIHVGQNEMRNYMHLALFSQVSALRDARDLSSSQVHYHIFSSQYFIKRFTSQSSHWNIFVQNENRHETGSSEIRECTQPCKCHK